jgi:hypothetical protein
MAAYRRTALSVLWLLVKLIVLVLLMSSARSSFIYQNF